MPAALAILPMISAIAGLVTTGVTLGEQLFNSPSAPPAPPPGPTPQQLAQQQQQQLQQRASLISNQAPNLVSDTSGFVSPQYLADVGALQTGQAGQSGAIQRAIEMFTGQGAGTGSGTFPGSSAPIPTTKEMENIFQLAGGGPGGSRDVSSGFSDMLGKWV